MYSAHTVLLKEFGQKNECVRIKRPSGRAAFVSNNRQCSLWSTLICLFWVWSEAQARRVPPGWTELDQSFSHSMNSKASPAPMYRASKHQCDTFDTDSAESLMSQLTKHDGHTGSVAGNDRAQSPDTQWQLLPRRSPARSRQVDEVGLLLSCCG